MLQDFLTDVTPLTQHTDVCIVGAGVAGQTLALQQAKNKTSVLLVESGGKDFNAKTQSLSDGDNVGAEYYPLETARLRMFGGTASIWGGRCAELDEIDFFKRDYIPYSGWPIKKFDLDPYYESAFKSLGLRRPSAGRLWGVTGKSKPIFDPNKLDADLWCFDENGGRFTDTGRITSAGVNIMLNATLTAIDVNDKGHVDCLTFSNMNGQKKTIKAKVSVIAAGAIETIRLLLSAVPRRPKGLGNQHDNVGRYFMEHPHARGGQIIPSNITQSLMVLPRALRVNKQRYAAYLRPADALQRERGILNSSISFAPRRHEDGNMEIFRSVTNKVKHDLPSTKLWRTLYKNLKGLAVRGLEWTDPWSSVLNMKASNRALGLYAIVRGEQAPHPESRVTLSDRVDSFGIPLAALDWKFSEIDKRSVRILMETLKSEYQRLGWGDVTLAKWMSDKEKLWETDPLISAHPIGGYHHMGGTRMGDDVSSSVVDRNCKLHESPNLYIASSSVFPTSGWANPTVTIMALSERLGDHITQTLK